MQVREEERQEHDYGQEELLVADERMIIIKTSKIEKEIARKLR